MSFDSLIDRFTKQAPVATMVRVAVANILAPTELDAIFHDRRVRQYQDNLLFSSMVHLLGLVVTKASPSIYAAYKAHRESFTVSVRAVYDKIAGVELPVTRELVARTGRRIAAAVDAIRPPTPLLPGYRTYILDGSHLAATQHRLKEMRAVRGGPLPGHGLVVLDADRRLIRDFIPTRDGHEQERQLLTQWIDLLEPGQLWIADRNFCTKLTMFECQLNQCHFVVRAHGSLKPEPCGELRVAGRCAKGQVSEQEMLIRGEPGQKLDVRQITLDLDAPTSDGTSRICILTNLPPDVSAVAVTDLYGERWTVEAVFGELTLSLRGEIDTLAYPEAALLGYAIALVTFNLLALVKAAMSVVHGEAKVAAEVSTYYLAEEVSRVSEGLEIAVPSEEWSRRYGVMSPATLATTLAAMAGHTKLARYRKHPRGVKKPRVKREGRSPHISTARLLAERKRR
jgi:hypothetical protein